MNRIMAVDFIPFGIREKISEYDLCVKVSEVRSDGIGFCVCNDDPDEFNMLSNCPHFVRDVMLTWKNELEQHVNFTCAYHKISHGNGYCSSFVYTGDYLLFLSIHEFASAISDFELFMEGIE